MADRSRDGLLDLKNMIRNIPATVASVTDNMISKGSIFGIVMAISRRGITIK
jgi:hypothetical protein